MQLARDSLDDPAQPAVLRRREQHDDVALRVGRASEHGRERARGAGAGGALGGGEHADAPVVVGGREVVRADDDHRAALAQVRPELGGAGEDVAAVGHLALEERGQERGLGGLGGAVGCAQALDLAGDHRRGDPQHRGRGPAAARSQAQAADDRVAHASSCVSTPSASRISERSSAVERAATASTELERSISTSEASSARDAARTTSGSPRPDSTASDIALSAPRSGSAASLRAGEDTEKRLVRFTAGR